jgi:hypothetical protein
LFVFHFPPVTFSKTTIEAKVWILSRDRLTLKCYYEIRGNNSGKLYYDNQSVSAEIKASKHWQLVNLTIPIEKTRSLRFDFGEKPKLTFRIKDIFLKGALYHRKSLLNSFDNHSGLIINNECEYYELQTTDGNPVWATADISKDIANIKVKDSTAELILNGLITIISTLIIVMLIFVFDKVFFSAKT